MIEGGTKSVHNIPSSVGLAASRYSISAVHRSAVSCPALPLHRTLLTPQSVSAKFYCSKVNSKSSDRTRECAILSLLWYKVLVLKFLLFPSGILIKRAVS